MRGKTTGILWLLLADAVFGDRGHDGETYCKREGSYHFSLERAIYGDGNHVNPAEALFFFGAFACFLERQTLFYYCI
jgi:hypothetical protein